MNVIMILYEVLTFSISEPKIIEIEATRTTEKCYYTYNSLFEKEVSHKLKGPYSAVFKTLEEAQKYKKNFIDNSIARLKKEIEERLKKIKDLESIYS